MTKLCFPVIAGATASGKTACAVALCEMLHGEVISADSMQIYKGMDILTAKPTPEEMRGIPHHMLGVIPPTDAFSASKFRKYVWTVEADIRARGHQAVVCGGTGLYIDALTRPESFSQEGSPELRAELDAIVAQADGKRRLHDMLRAVDPESAVKYHENDVRRVRRALEIYRLTGHTQSEQARIDRAAEAPWEGCIFALDWQRDTLYARIDARVDAMVKAGLIDEVRGLMSDARHPTAIQAIGYKEIASALRGEISMEEAIYQVKLASRHYAKRQLTWFRRDERVQWLPADGKSAEELANQMYHIWTQYKEKKA